MNKVISILNKVGAITSNSHIVLTTGRHSDGYINKDALYIHTFESSEIGKLMALKFKDEDIDIVVAPALGGIVLSQWVAYHLTKLKKKEILAAYTDKDENKDQVLRRGYHDLVKGKNILIVEDITATGSSVKKVINTVRKEGGNVLAVCVMVNRDTKLVTSETIDAPLYPLEVFEIESYEESDCPMCKKNIPINTKVGHGKKYLEAKNMKKNE